MVVWEHKDLVGLRMVMVDLVEVLPEKCHKCCLRQHCGCIMNLLVGSACPSDEHSC